MNKSEKAKAVLDFISEWDSDTIISTLQAYISDECLANLYDKLEEEGMMFFEETEENYE